MRARTIPRWLLASVLVVGVTGATALVAAAPAAALPGHVLETASSDYDSTNTKSVVAWCPSGTVVVGGGGRTVGGYNEVLLTGVRPFVTIFGTGLQVLASEDGTGYAASWRLYAIAICAQRPPGLEYVYSAGQSSSQSSRWVQAWCPAGKNVLGTGGMIFNGQGQVGLQQILPTPNPPNRVVVRAHEDENGFSGSWSLASWAVCADPVPGLELVSGDDGTVGMWAAIVCPGGKRSYGVGVGHSGDPANVRLTDLYPYPPDGYGTLASTASDETGADQPWEALAFAICAD